MRCIEMIYNENDIYGSPGLTLTWDVLKCSYMFRVSSLSQWLTLTWDVLKWLLE